MTFVITQACCDDASCVPVCPVQCIHPRPGDPEFTTTEQLYIDPSTCIDCGNCAFACPVEAIVHEADLSPSQAEFRAINADYFTAHPLKDVQPLPIERRRLPQPHQNIKVAIVGAGPSALYAAGQLSEIPGVSVTIVEKTPMAHGLVRTGVAPDHDQTKLIGDTFDRVLRRPNVTSFLNVEVGRDISLEELQQHHHAVIWAAGASEDRRLGIPGEGLAGSVTAREFTSWYNGHPDYAEHEFNLSGPTAVVIGNGNVALDAARLLTQPTTLLSKTSISDRALSSMRTSGIEEVIVIGRRGPADAAYSTAELLALSHLPQVDLVTNPADFSDPEYKPTTSRIVQAADFARRRAILLQATRRTGTAPRRIVMRYRLTPTRLIGERAVSEIVLSHPDGTSQSIKTSLVISAIGFRGRAVPGMPFDQAAGVIPHDRGRVVDAKTGLPLPGLYCTGWIKRGPTGVIGTNRSDAAETIASLLSDIDGPGLPTPVQDPAQLAQLLEQRQPDRITAEGWWRINEAERSAGRAAGRPRVKLLTTADLLRVAAQNNETSAAVLPDERR